MRKIDRRRNLQNANILAEQRYLKSKGLLMEELLYESDDSLAISLQSLAKYNGGKFKSDKQRNFILNKTEKIGENEWEYVSNNSYSVGERARMTWRNYFILDSLGVKKIIKYTEKGGDTVQWERNAESEEKSLKLHNWKERINSIKKEIDEKVTEYENKKNELYTVVSDKNSQLKLGSYKGVWVTEWERIIKELEVYSEEHCNKFKDELNKYLSLTDEKYGEEMDNFVKSIINIYQAAIELCNLKKVIFDLEETKRNLSV
jgi:hypothetical protein